MQSKKSGFAASVSVALLAALLSAFAPLASAGGSHEHEHEHEGSSKKTISLSVTPTNLSIQTTVVSATITNTGNSNANSFEVDWTPSPYFAVTGASVGGDSGSCSSSGCVFLKQLPTKSSVTVTLDVQVANQCTPLSITWVAHAWTGSPGSVSTSFALEPPPSITSFSPSCSIKFVTQPKDAFNGSTITGSPFSSNGTPVSVKLLQNGAPAVAGTDVSLIAPSGCATGASATTDATGAANLNATAAAVSDSCVLTASAPGYGSDDSQSFKVVQPAGELGCDPGNNAIQETSGAGGLVFNGTRLGNVDDPASDAVGGSNAPACVVVPYAVSTTCPTGVAGACTDVTYDPLDQGTHMAFHFTWDWPIESIPDGGIDAIPKTLQLFINGNPTPVELDLCPHTIAVYNTNNEFVELIADPAYTGSLPHPQDQDLVAPGTQAGCLIGRNVFQNGAGLKLIEEAWVQGDYAARRN